MEMLPSAASFFFSPPFLLLFAFQSSLFPFRHGLMLASTRIKEIKSGEFWWRNFCVDANPSGDVFFFIADTLLVTNFELPLFHSNNKIVKRKE